MENVLQLGDVLKLEDILETGPVLDQICQELTFEELTRLWMIRKKMSINCNFPVETKEGEIITLRGINEETVAAYPFLLRHGEDEDTDALNFAISNGDRLAVLGLLKSSYSWDPNEGYVYGVPGQYCTPMQIAALFGQIDILEILREWGGVIVKETSDQGNDLLQFALTGQKLPMVKYLLDQGVNPNNIFDNYSYFDSAVSEFLDNYNRKYQPEVDIAMIDLLIEYGGKVDAIRQEGDRIYRGHPLSSALNSQHPSPAVVEHLLELGCDPNLLDNRTHDAGFRFYPIIQAINLESPNFIELLLKYGADPLLPPNNSVLIESCKRGLVELVDLVLEKGSNVNQLDNTGKSILYIALESLDTVQLPTSAVSRVGLVYLLLERGADPNFQNGLNSAFLKALAHAPSSIIQYMLEKGANPNASFAPNNLHPLNVVVNRDSELTLILLEAGANPNIFTHHGKSLLSIWIVAENYLVVKSILDHGGDPNLGSPTQGYPLYYAIRNDNYPVFKLLIDKGANIDQTYQANDRPVPIRKFLSNFSRPLMKQYLK